MAQLKLMKKEWFDWFKNTTLDNITSWTEYYYINPDSQHWISNYQLWDEEWEVGYINEQGEAESGDRTIRPKNFIQVSPNEAYYAKGYPIARIFFYDINHNFISRLTDKSDSTFVTPNSCHYIKFLLGTAYGLEYKHDICFNKSNPTFNGHYEPRIIKIEDIIDVVDLGSLTWQSSGTDNGFYSQTLNTLIKKPSSASVVAKAFSSYFKVVSASDVFAKISNKIIGVYTDGNLYTFDTEYDDPTSFKQGMNGKYFVYIKANSPLG